MHKTKLCATCKGKIIFSASVCGKTMEKLVKFTVASHKTCLWNECNHLYLLDISVLPTVLQIVHIHTLVLDKHKRASPTPPYIYICIFFSFHTLNMFLLSNLIYAEFNLTVLGEGNTTWYRATTFLKGNCSSSLKVFLIKNMQKYEWECYTIMYFRIKSMSFLSLKCHIGNDKTWSHFV